MTTLNRGDPINYTNDQTIWEDLANAIIVQAAEDYRSALKHLNHPNPEKRQRAEKQKLELERFFHSRWYARLTTLDPDYLLSRLQAEQEEKPASALKKPGTKPAGKTNGVQRQKGNRSLSRRMNIYNPSHCLDLTAALAIDRVMQEEKRARQKAKKRREPDE